MELDAVGGERLSLHGDAELRDPKVSAFPSARSQSVQQP